MENIEFRIIKKNSKVLKESLVKYIMLHSDEILNIPFLIADNIEIIVKSRSKDGAILNCTIINYWNFAKKQSKVINLTKLNSIKLGWLCTFVNTIAIKRKDSKNLVIY